VLSRTSVVGASGETSLEQLALKDLKTGQIEQVSAQGLFLMLRAIPRSEWLPDEVIRDGHGFVVTGAQIPPSRGRQTNRRIPWRPASRECSLSATFEQAR